MDTVDYIWLNGEFVPWHEAKIHVLTHTLHYGGGAFEGIRCYETKRGPAVFRLADHLERLIVSAKKIKMTLPYSKEALTEVCLELIRKNKLAHCYLRPIIYYGYGKMGVNPKGAPVNAAIACWPWGAYLPHDVVHVKTSQFIRIHPRSTYADAKICGHYVDSILAVQELEGSAYHEALFLDFEGHIAEGPGENIFIVKNGSLKTPPLGTILPGITRNTIIHLAKFLSYPLQECILTPNDVYAADEAFFTGTAAEVTAVGTIDDRTIGSGQIGPITRQLKQLFQQVVCGEHKEFLHYLSFVE